MKNKIKRNVLIKALVAIFVLFVCILFFIPTPITGNISLLTRLINALSGVTNYGFSYEVYGYSEDTGKYNILLSFENPDGIRDMYDRQKNNTINANGRNKISIDYIVEDFSSYDFDITLADGTVKHETFYFERTRYGKDTYKNVKGVYANTPNLEGYKPEFTRYLQYTADGILQPANWITDDEPENWYDYNGKDNNNNQSPKWANIYVENEGVEDYLVWIPRYCYKMPESNESGNERVDIKFIDVYNNYISPEEGRLTWNELKVLGYKIPEAFEFGKYNESSLSGYWISKYELSDLAEFKIDYNLTASSTAFEITELTKNTTTEVAKYTFAINGQVQDYQPTDIEDFTFINGAPNMDNTINVTALDSDGRIVGSMTRKVQLADCNAPDLTGFNPNTTFYVYYDSDGNEHNEIPITQDPPEEWYNYTYRQWANIVTRNNGLENYLVWIPRYQYRLNTTNQRVSIKFIKGTGTETEVGYQIPEAFTWQKGLITQELEGYWISKYEISDEPSQPKVTADIGSGEKNITIKNITGTAIVLKQENNIDLKAEYYLNETKITESEDISQDYIYRNLDAGQEYTINIVIREKESNKYVGAITKTIKTIKINRPKFDGFNTNEQDDNGERLPVPYYVTWDIEGNKTIGEKVSADGSNAPANWYDYADNRWANIVITDGNIVNGQIENDTTTNYLVWIPRYQYRLNSVTERVDIIFIDGTLTETEPGYKIPEAFTWQIGNETKELEGYWISKYELVDK